MGFKTKADVFTALSEVKEDKKTLLKRIKELEEDNQLLLKKLKDQEQIVDFLRKQNKYLLPLYTCKLPKDKAIYFMSYLCSYYKVSIDQIIGDLRITPLPYIRQISCYFLIKHFDWTIYEVRDYLECERTMVMHNVQKIVDLVDVDRTVLKDVLAHRDWLEKLNKV